MKTTLRLRSVSPDKNRNSLSLDCIGKTSSTKSICSLVFAFLLICIFAHLHICTFAQPAWVVSAAALGDTSVYIYPVSWTPDTTLTLRHPSNQDSLKVSTVTGTPNGIHIYRVNAAPSITTGISNLSGNNRYFGVFTANGTNPTYTATYYYKNNPLCCPSPENTLRLYKRSDNAATPWTDALATQDSSAAKTYTKTAESPRGEYILGLGTPPPAPPAPTCIHPTTTCNALVQNGFGPLWVMSAAPLGDSSTYIYPASWTGTSIVLHHLCEQDSLGVSSVTGTPDGVHIYRVDTAPCITTGITGLGSNNRYFGVFTANGTNPTYTATYYYGGNPYVNTGNESNLLLFNRSDNAASPWADVSATLDVTANTLTKTNQSSRGEYILGLSSGTLPIELLYFSSRWKDDNYNTAVCEWETATEINNDYFVVERSQDARYFAPLLKVYSQGNSTAKQSYVAYDYAPNKDGISYYRLKQVDKNGSYTYSQTEMLSAHKRIQLISIYPNPARNHFEYLVGSVEGVSVKVRIMDALGRIIMAQTDTAAKGINKRQLDVSSLANGNYILQISIGDEDKTEKQFLINEK